MDQHPYLWYIGYWEFPPLSPPPLLPSTAESGIQTSRQVAPGNGCGEPCGCGGGRGDYGHKYTSTTDAIALEQPLFGTCSFGCCGYVIKHTADAMNKFQFHLVAIIAYVPRTQIIARGLALSAIRRPWVRPRA